MTARKKRTTCDKSSSRLVQGYLISLSGCKPVTIPDTLHSIYETLKCSQIAMPTRFIDGRAFIFICDDEVFLKNPVPSITARDPIYGENIHGDILVVGRADKNGDITSLSDPSVKFVKKHIAPDGVLIYSTKKNYDYDTLTYGKDIIF